MYGGDVAPSSSNAATVAQIRFVKMRSLVSVLCAEPVEVPEQYGRRNSSEAVSDARNVVVEWQKTYLYSEKNLLVVNVYLIRYNDVIQGNQDVQRFLKAASDIETTFGPWIFMIATDVTLIICCRKLGTIVVESYV